MKYSKKKHDQGCKRMGQKEHYKSLESFAQRWVSNWLEGGVAFTEGHASVATREHMHGIRGERLVEAAMLCIQSSSAVAAS